MIARGDLGDGCADLLDDPRPLVSEDTRQRNGEVLITADEVRMADADTGDRYENFVVPGALIATDSIWNGPDFSRTTAALICISGPLFESRARRHAPPHASSAEA